MGRYDGDVARMLSLVLGQEDIHSRFRRSAGLVKGVGQEFKFGFNAGVGTTSIPIWDVTTAYSYLTSARVLTLSSDSPADTLLGTGARTVRIYGQGDDGVEINETLNLDGQTAVPTASAYRRVYRAQVLTAGDENGTNVGNVFVGASVVTNGVPSEKYAMIRESMGQTLMAIYTVPANNKAYLTDLSLISAGGVIGVATLKLHARERGGAWNVLDQFVIHDNSIDVAYARVPLVIPAGSDIEVRGMSDKATLSMSATFALILISDDVDEHN